MATKKKLLEAAAGSAGGGGLNIEELFSTYVYSGTSANRSINNGIDLSTEGGAVWFKGRTGTYNHILYDTERGALEVLRPNRTDSSSQLFGTNGLTAFNTDGFSITGGNGELNYSGQDYASWTFRKHPDFFNVIEYTGDGSNSRDLPHGLNKKPGFIVVKRTDSTGDWVCSHRSSTIGELNSSVAFTGSTTSGTPGENGYAILNAFSNDTTVRIANGTGGLSNANANGASYVAYIWAHNDGDGTFGPTQDQDIIKCGSYTGDGTTDGTNEVTLGFEPQWILTKRSNGVDNWHICDVMRSQTTDGVTQRLIANTNTAEVGAYGAVPTPTGFKLYSDNSSGGTYIYIAIRRGPMAVPESATDVFAVDTSVNASFPRFTSNFPVDFAISTTTNAGDPRAASSRLTSGKWMRTNDTNAESTNSAYVFDSNDGYFDSTLTNGLAWMWRRAPNYFDVVAGTGTSTLDAVSHNLGVTPELIIQKKRSGSSSMDWFVTGSGVGGTNKYLILNSTAAVATTVTLAHDASTFTPIFDQDNYIAYLFASLDGVSKVGSYTGNGSSQTIDCGFSSGARFVLIKQTDTSGTNWFVFDSERGIVSGNDSALRLNTTDAAVTNEDAIDPVSSGFSVTNSNGFIDTNNSGGTYIFYAIA